VYSSLIKSFKHNLDLVIKLSFIVQLSYFIGCVQSKKLTRIELESKKAISMSKSNNPEGAISAFEKILSELNGNSKNINLWRANTHNLLGDAYRVDSNITDFRKAINHYEEASTIFESYGEKHHLAPTLLNLGLAYQAESRFTSYKKSLTYYNQALELYTKLIDHTAISITQKHLGSVLSRMGKYREALKAFRSSLKRQQAQVSTKDFTILELEYFADAYSGLGEYHLAREVLTTALNEDNSTESKINNSRILTAIGCTFTSTHQNEKAVKFFNKALESGKEVLGQFHYDLAPNYHNLGFVEQNATIAIGYFEKALDLFKQKLPINHPRLTDTYSGLMYAYFDLDDLNRSMEFAQMIIEINRGPSFLSNPTSLANAHYILGTIQGLEGRREEEIRNLQEALEIGKKSLGQTHPQTFFLSMNLIEAHWAWGESNASLKLAEELLKNQEEHFTKVLSYLPVTDRISFFSEHNPFSHIANIQDSSLLTTTVLRRKGLALETIIEDRTCNIDLNYNEKEISSILKGSGAKSRTRRAFSLNPEDFINSIPVGSVYFDYVLFDNWEDESDSKWIGSIVITGGKKSPSWIPLCKAETLLSDLENLKESISINGSGSKVILENLHLAMVQPLLKSIPTNTKTLIICPDAELNFLPFPALIDEDGKFLCEKYEILNVSAGRDLVFGNETQTKSNDVILFADPSFEGKSATEGNALALREIDRNAMRDLSFAPLPGTRVEATKVSSLTGRSGLTSHSYIGTKATEKALSQITSPKILHLATHGFFISSEEEKKSENRWAFLNDNQFKGPISNPMHRSGLALAGAKQTLSLWKEGKSVDPDNDGILTAEEASALDLSGTWLTVLSACDTGSGIARAGEGVLGLRRAFAMAGTQNLLLTLWPVSDAFTKDFMVSFYEEALKTGNAPRAMAKVQKEWLIKLREERSIGQAVKLAGPFVLTFRGNPELN
jgi:CHAT domain-containing protein/tetratricopeptide (TPR) repeat protein